MTGVVLRNEWRRARRSWVALGLAIGITLVLGAAIRAAAARAHHRDDDVRAAREAQDADRARLLKRLDKAVAAGKSVGYYDSRSPAYAGGTRGRRYAVLPPEPGAWLAVGQSDLLPAALAVSTEDRPELLSSGEQENAEHLAAGGLDPAFVIVVLLPLVVLALSFDLLSGEREAGTLAIVLSHPITAMRYALIRALAVWLGVMALVTAATALAFATSDLGLDRQDPGVVAAALGITGAYLAFWLAAAVAVQSRAWTSATNAAALAALWLVLVVLGPAAMNTLVTGLHPAPSRLEFVQARREAARHAEEEGAGDLAEYYQDHPELAAGDGGDAKVDDYTLKKLILADHVAEAVAPLEAAFDTQSRAQQALIDRLRFFSPAVVTWQALTDLAGTSARRYRAFADRAARFRAAWDGWFRPKIFAKTAITRADYQRFPTWEGTPAEAPEAGRRVATGAGWLGLVSVVLLLAAAPAMRRYPARR